MQPTKDKIDEKARELFAVAKETGTLKAPPGLYAASIGRGPIRSASCELTWRNYRPEARAWFKRKY